MQSELRKEVGNQSLTLEQRKKLDLTGVKKINSLNNEEFIVVTNLGVVQITGDNLEMVQLEINKGFLQITGKIDKIEYVTETPKEKKKIFGKLFKWHIH